MEVELVDVDEVDVERDVEVLAEVEELVDEVEMLTLVDELVLLVEVVVAMASFSSAAIPTQGILLAALVISTVVSSDTRNSEPIDKLGLAWFL